MSSSWNREMETMPNLYNGLDYSSKTLLESMCQRGFLQKDENEGCDLYENLAEKTIQWGPTNENSRNSNSISSKWGLHLIESSIAAEARIANLARRLKVLETKDQFQSTKSAQTNFQLRAVLTVKSWIMCLRSVLCSKLNNNIPVSYTHLTLPTIYSV